MTEQMTGLVLEGGTFRGIFSAGVMDAFIEAGVEFPYVVGVSAGTGVFFLNSQMTAKPLHTTALCCTFVHKFNEILGR